MAGLELTPNMSQLIRRSVEDLGATVIIISDSNTEFIDHILRERNLHHLVDKVFTNPANWNSEGKLLIQPYHHQVLHTRPDHLYLQQTNIYLFRRLANCPPRTSAKARSWRTISKLVGRISPCSVMLETARMISVPP